MAAKVEIYTWETCPFCLRAKALLKQKGVEFTEYGLDGDEEGRFKMSKRANGRTSLPQIFISYLIIVFCRQAGTAADGHVGGRALHEEIIGVGVAVVDIEVAFDLVKRQSLAEQVAKIEGEAPWQGLDTEQAEQAPGGGGIDIE